MRRLPAIVAAFALCAACAHRRTAAGSAAPAAAPQPSAFERQIRNAIDAGEGDVALRTLQRRMAAEPEKLEPRLELARLYAARGQEELALEHYRLAAARFPGSGEVAVGIAKARRRLGLREEAERGLAAFLDAHPQRRPEAQSWLGILRDELGRWKQGEAAHRAALALAPNTGYLHNNLGYNLLMQGRHAEAAGEFRQAVALNPASTLARNNLGLALASTTDQAIAEWQAVSDAATAHSNMAAVLIEQGRYGEARRELEIALGYNKTHSAALNNLRLVSQLDGKPASFTARTAPSRWTKAKSAVRGLFVGPAGDNRKAETGNSGPDAGRGQ